MADYKRCYYTDNSTPFWEHCYICMSATCSCPQEEGMQIWTLMKEAEENASEEKAE